MTVSLSTLISPLRNGGEDFTEDLPGSNVTELSVEEQQIVAKDLADSRSDSVVIRHLKMAHSV